MKIRDIEDWTRGKIDRAVIVYELNGKRKEWAIGAQPGVDNETTIRTHLKRWIPKAKFISFRWEA